MPKRVKSGRHARWLRRNLFGAVSATCKRSCGGALAGSIFRGNLDLHLAAATGRCKPGAQKAATFGTP